MSSGPPGMYAPPPGQANMMPGPPGTGPQGMNPPMQQWGQHRPQQGKPESMNQGPQFQNGQPFNQMNTQMGQMNLRPEMPNMPLQHPHQPPQHQISSGPPSHQPGPMPPTEPMRPPISQPMHSNSGMMPPTSRLNSMPVQGQPRYGPPGAGMPPSSMAGPGMPPHSQPGQPPNGRMHPGPPTSMAGSGMPPVHMAGSGFPSTMPGPAVPPNNMNGLGISPSYGMPQAGAPGVPPQTGAGMPTLNNMPPRPSMPMRPGSAPYNSSGPGMPPPPGQGMMSTPGMPPQHNMGPMPPRPGMPPAMMGGSMPGQQYPPQPQAAPPPKRLDAEQMPSAVQVMMADMRDRSGVFQTAQRGAVPPLVTTKFTCHDQGNCNPRFLRSTMYSIPVNGDMMKQCSIPLGMICSPYARTEQGEMPPPLVNLGEIGPVRCKRCRAYMSPFMQFVDGGRRFSCPFCLCSTDVPQEYFQHLDHTGKRVDTYDRPELHLGSYEFVATKDYCKNSVLPTQPAFIFMIDVSYNSVKSGLVHLLCQHLKDDILPNLPKEHGMEESEMRVGFVTYSNVLHFYNVKGSLVQPQMLVVSDVEDMFVPMVDGFLVKPSEASTVIESLLEQLPTMFADARETDVVLGPVIQAGLDALKSAGCPGKLFIFHSSLPIAEAPGKLKQRGDAAKVLGTDKEKTAFEPQIPFYTTLGQECVAQGCGVDLFLFPNSYIDVATIGQVPKLTGGDIYKYDYFTADSHGTQFINDLRTAVGRQIAFDVIVRVRTSTGLRPVDFLGNFYMANTTDVELAVVDCDKAFAVEVKHDDKLNESDGAYVQMAMLFTSVTGQRRLRIHNLSLNVCSQMADVFKNSELDTLVNFLSKKAVREQMLKTPKDVRETTMNQCAEILACYRRNCATNTASGQLILPETMKLLPLYTNCIMKSDALQAGPEMTADSRSTYLHMLNSMDVKSSVPFLYPRLLPLHDLDPDAEQLPIPMRCSYDRLAENGAYLLENGCTMHLWLGHAVSTDFIQDMFGVSSLAQVNVEKPCVVEMNNPTSKRVHGIINTIMRERGRFMKLLIVRQRDKLEQWFNHYLVEDKGATGSPSYVDYLLHIHKEIRVK